jgi:hypothetical protein
MLIENLNQEQLAMIRSSVGPIQSMILHLDDVDVSKGSGQIGPTSKCIWTTDRRRITFDLVQGGGFIGSIGNEPDPDCP